jgi:hypothetical protein
MGVHLPSQLERTPQLKRWNIRESGHCHSVYTLWLARQRLKSWN